MIVTAFFQGLPGDPLDALCRSIFERHDGELISRGTYFGGDKPERDVEYLVPQTSVAACAAELRAYGLAVDIVRELDLYGELE